MQFILPGCTDYFCPASNSLKIKPSSVTHILISDSKVTDPDHCAKFGEHIINSGHPDYKVSSDDIFYMFHYPKKKTIKGFFTLRKPTPVNKEAKFINEISSVISHAARISAKEYQRRRTANEKAIRKITQGVEAKKHLRNPDLGNLSTKNQSEIFQQKGDRVQKAKNLRTRAAEKIGLPDPVVCWTTTGNGDKTFKQAVKKASQVVNVENIYKADAISSSDQLNSHKLQHVFLNNYTVNDNRLDRAMANIGMEWSAKRGTRNPVSLKNLLTDSFYSSEYALLKRRTQVSALKHERDQLHPAFSATSKSQKNNMLKSKAPMLSSHGAVKSAIKAGSVGAAGVFGALLKSQSTGELDALTKSAGAIAEKSAIALNGTLGSLYKTINVASEATASNASLALTVAGAATVGFVAANAIHGGALQKAKLLFGEMRAGDLSSMPTSELTDLETAAAFRASLTV
ncbi:hypothetical protein ACJJIQ_09420 [Microbulbifer sp. ANSA003]|uniref:hypothetical protein n=1 Tax=Microbulbifer sp. ANSA003 TaxID=3243360 RepID=UPI0040421E0E